MRFILVILASWIAVALGQRPANTSICDYYTTALLKTNNATNQYNLLVLLVNTAVIGNYTKNPAPKNAVNGILNNGTYNGSSVTLLPYFDGGLDSINVKNGSPPGAQNFLDGGGAAPLMMNMPANDMTSNQYFLLTHLYQFFGALLGCTMYGKTGFPSYGGDPSMYNVHKYMDLTADQIGYFNEQVGLAAASFGVAASDVTMVGNSLNAVFNVRCPMNMTVVPEAGPQAQSICVDATCPMAANASTTCPAPAMQPFDANDTLAEGQGIPMSSSASPSASSSSGSPAAAASSTAMALEFSVFNTFSMIALVIGAMTCGLIS